MDTFDFPYHLHSYKHPESGPRMTLGNSYQFASEPSAPDQRILTLKFATLKYFTTLLGAIDASTHPEINAHRLANFYAAHRLWQSFIYVHPVLGSLVVKFNKPLELPEGIPGGNGAIGAVTLEFMEQP